MKYGRSITKMQFQNVIFVVSFSMLMCIDLANPQYYDIPPSPCPQLFQYKYNGNDWIGELELPSPPIEHHEVILHITLTLRAATTVRYCVVIVVAVVVIVFGCVMCVCVVFLDEGKVCCVYARECPDIQKCRAKQEVKSRDMQLVYSVLYTLGHNAARIAPYVYSFQCQSHIDISVITHTRIHIH